MQHADRQFGFVFVDQYRDFDFRGGNGLHVDTALGQCLEHRGRDTGVAAHADANDRDFGDLGVMHQV